MKEDCEREDSGGGREEEEEEGEKHLDSRDFEGVGEALSSCPSSPFLFFSSSNPFARLFFSPSSSSLRRSRETKRRKGRRGTRRRGREKRRQKNEVPASGEWYGEEEEEDQGGGGGGEEEEEEQEAKEKEEEQEEQTCPSTPRLLADLLADVLEEISDEDKKLPFSSSSSSSSPSSSSASSSLSSSFSASPLSSSSSSGGCSCALRRKELGEFLLFVHHLTGVETEGGFSFSSSLRPRGAEEGKSSRLTPRETKKRKRASASPPSPPAFSGSSSSAACPTLPSAFKSEEFQDPLSLPLLPASSSLAPPRCPPHSPSSRCSSADDTTQSTVYIHSERNASSLSPSSLSSQRSNSLLQSLPCSPRVLQPGHPPRRPSSPLPQPLLQSASSSSSSAPCVPSLARPSLPPEPPCSPSSSQPLPPPPPPPVASSPPSLSLPPLRGAGRQVSVHPKDSQSSLAGREDETSGTSRTVSSFPSSLASSSSCSSSLFHPLSDTAPSGPGGSLTSDPPSFVSSLTSDASSPSSSFLSSSLRWTAPRDLREGSLLSVEDDQLENGGGEEEEEEETEEEKR